MLAHMFVIYIYMILAYYCCRLPACCLHYRLLHSFVAGGVALQLHNNRMGISGFAQWYPFGIKGDGGAQSKKKGGGGPYQKADENMLFRFKIGERD